MRLVYKIPLSMARWIRSECQTELYLRSLQGLLAYQDDEVFIVVVNTTEAEKFRCFLSVALRVINGHREERWSEGNGHIPIEFAPIERSLERLFARARQECPLPIELNVLTIVLPVFADLGFPLKCHKRDHGPWLLAEIEDFPEKGCWLEGVRGDGKENYPFSVTVEQKFFNGPACIRLFWNGSTEKIPISSFGETRFHVRAGLERLRQLQKLRIPVSAG